MSLDLQPNLDFHLSMDENSLAPFRAAWVAASRDHTRAPQHTARDAVEHHAALGAHQVAPFLRDRLAAIPQIARMLSDQQWRIDAAAQAALCGALSYFLDPADLIPDHQGKFGLLDDAIVIELALTAHAEEWLAWREFDDSRNLFAAGTVADRQSWTGELREALVRSLQQRRQWHSGHYAPRETMSELRPH